MWRCKSICLKIVLYNKKINSRLPEDESHLLMDITEGSLKEYQNEWFPVQIMEDSLSLSPNLVNRGNCVFIKLCTN